MGFALIRRAVCSYAAMCLPKFKDCDNCTGAASRHHGDAGVATQSRSRKYQTRKLLAIIQHLRAHQL
jgi:hypothetical protein